MKQLRRNERAGTGAVFAIEQHGRIVGQISLGAICYGAMRSGVVGYWVDERCAGRGYAPMAVALLADWAIVQTRPDPRLHRHGNRHSCRKTSGPVAVARKVGATLEGVRRAYMYVNGQWRDHESYVLMAEDAPNGFTARLMTGNSPS